MAASADGLFILSGPELGFEIHAGTLAGVKHGAAQRGIAAQTVDVLA